MRVKRVQHVTNALLEATARLLPDDVRARWNGNVCVDATLIRTWGKRGHPKPKPNRDNSTDRMSPEIIAGWYVRDEPRHGQEGVSFRVRGAPRCDGGIRPDRARRLSAARASR